MRLLTSPLAIVLFLGWCLGSSLHAVTLEQLEETPDLCPERFAHFFSTFEFRFHDAVQSPETFLSTRSGDCDDYAILAARVLKKRGYTPHLIAVRMPKLVHVVCYISETGSYLDYNLRADALGTVRCGPAMSEIATRVAQSYGTQWSSASEFTVEAGAKRLVQTVLGGERQVASAK
jgi:hypothetical protein